MLKIEDFNYYTSELEILTSTGFKPLAELKQTDYIAQYDLNLQRVLFLQPYYIRTIKADFECYELRRATQSAELIGVIPLDNYVPLWVRSNVLGDSIAEYPVRDLTPSGFKELVRKFKVVSRATTSGLNLHDRFNIAIQADGTVCEAPTMKTTNYNGRVTFSFAKEDKMYRLETLLEDMEMAYDIQDSYVDSRGIPQSVKYSIQTPFIPYKRFSSWVNLADKNLMWMRMFLEELSHWDCHVSNYGLKYSNKNWSDLSIVQGIAALTGADTSISLDQSSGVYSLNINRTGNSRKLGIDCNRKRVNALWFSVGAAPGCQYLVVRGNRTVFLASAN